MGARFRPAAARRPRASSSAYRRRFADDHLLSGFRGVNSVQTGRHRCAGRGYRSSRNTGPPRRRRHSRASERPSRAYGRRARSRTSTWWFFLSHRRHSRRHRTSSVVIFLDAIRERTKGSLRAAVSFFPYPRRHGSVHPGSKVAPRSAGSPGVLVVGEQDLGLHLGVLRADLAQVTAPEFQKLGALHGGDGRRAGSPLRTAISPKKSRRGR